ncbi:MAG TPA: HEAT repeat domain-containing protein [Planctomycetota bacterium]|nr:HEAT repeat domain-containing protein [Planctomycetota bacterium]
MRYKLSILVMIGLVFWLAVGNGADGATETFSETINKRVAELIRQLGSDDWQVREKATEELIEIGPLAIGEMQRARNNPDAEIRERAQKIIPLIQWKEAFIRRLDRFISQLRTGKFEDTVLFQDVMMFLSRDESVFILLDLLKDSSQSLAIKQQIVAVLSNNSAVSFKPVTNNLLELIQKEKDEQIRVGLLRILAKAGKDERSVAMALQLLKEGTPNMKSIAINILVDMGASSAVPEIMKAIKDADANVKNTAIYAFSRLKTEETTRELVRFMKEEPTGWLRAQAVAILANYNDAKLIPEFLAVLKSDKDFDVLRNTLYALQRFKGDKTIPPALLDFMKTASPQVQPNILSTFQALGDRSVVPELIKMLEKEMDYNGFHAMLGTLQSFAGNHKFTPQIVPDSLKNDIIAKAKDWWEKNK